ncbi:hypothetical protein TCAL_02054 [Tigriopus californicus]|uniref:Guanylate-binding protein N-terminal domain-containing protein n=1 Tax=Tigriopus californicus TaxID=6832 RepID=A0A553NB97_TIGCA|nr:nonsense-mediated mRNA decay factor SMG9-like [Tigriopus californicus]TRY62698.1 hypothetical protein TCAL_02054 [Tigriopus californicus]
MADRGDTGKRRGDNRDRRGGVGRARHNGESHSRPTGGFRGGRGGRDRFRDRRDHSNSNEDTPRPVIVAQNPDRQREQHNVDFPTLEQTVTRPSVTPIKTLSPESETPTTDIRPTVDSLAGVAESLERVRITPATAVRSATPNDDFQTAPPPANRSTSESSGSSLIPEKSLKFVDDGHQVTDSLLAYLTDNPDFLVIGIVGAQGAGKSTLLNHLCRGRPTSTTNLFRVQGFEKQMLSEHCTTGINVWVSPERVIYLDCQPLLSASVLDRTIQIDKKHSAEFNTAENTMEMHSLQHLAFFYNICHHVILIQDWFADSNVLRLLQTAEMLKPSSPAKTCESDEGSNQIVEHFPVLNFVQNKAQMNDFSPHQEKKMRDFYGRVFKDSQLHPSQPFLEILGEKKDAKKSVNLYILPDFDLEGPTNVGNRPFSPEIKYKTSVDAMRRAILSQSRRPLTIVKQTERTWFQFAKDSWENIKNSSFFLEYSRLLWSNKSQDL